MIKWSEKTVKVKDLKPYERNPRRISKEAYKKLKKSLAENGYHQRLICQPDLSIIGGHQRIKALKDLGIKEVEILIPERELTIEEFRRILVQDNLPFGEFDMDILSADFDIDELINWGMPESWLGDFSIEPSTGLTDPDEVPEKPEDPISVLGDMWLLGNHRLRCGDCTSATDVESLRRRGMWDVLN